MISLLKSGPRVSTGMIDFDTFGTGCVCGRCEDCSPLGCLLIK